MQPLPPIEESTLFRGGPRKPGVYIQRPGYKLPPQVQALWPAEALGVIPPRKAVYTRNSTIGPEDTHTMEHMNATEATTYAHNYLRSRKPADYSYPIMLPPSISDTGGVYGGPSTKLNLTPTPLYEVKKQANKIPNIQSGGVATSPKIGRAHV